MKQSRFVLAAFVVVVGGLSAGCKPSVCGNGLCEFGEGCGSCSTDCGSCGRCGDGLCSGSESCGSCTADCGSCGPFADPYETCTSTADCTNARDTCFFVSNRGVTRGMCTVTSCGGSDDLCDFDMFSSRGDCLSFGGSFDCYHRCLNDSDCYPGWGCYTPTGASGAIGNVCLPE